MTDIIDDRREDVAVDPEAASVMEWVEGEVELQAEELQRAVAEMPENRLLRWLALFGALAVVGFTVQSGLAAGGFDAVMVGMVPLVFLVVVFFAMWRVRRNARRSQGDRALGRAHPRVFGDLAGAFRRSVGFGEEGRMFACSPDISV